MELAFLILISVFMVMFIKDVSLAKVDIKLLMDYAENYPIIAHLLILH